jgi:hypothetical protein
VFPRGDKKADDSFFPERLGGLQPVQTLNQHKARAVGPHQDRRPLALVEHTGGDFVHALLFYGGAPFRPESLRRKESRATGPTNELD